MDVLITPDGIVNIGHAQFRCALGRAGIAARKREGDGATPAGRFVIRVGAEHVNTRVLFPQH